MKNSEKQKTIGINPLEDYLSQQKEKETDKTRENNYPSNEKNNTEKQRITIHISSDVVERLKNAVYWEPGLTMAAFSEEALEIALNKLEKERGGPFDDRREKKLKGGRPLK